MIRTKQILKHLKLAPTSNWDEARRRMQTLRRNVAATEIRRTYKKPRNAEERKFGRNTAAPWTTGLAVKIEHNTDEGKLISYYCHLSKINVSPGPIAAGTPIGLTGNTGTVDSIAHLHFELQLNGKKIDPSIFAPELKKG